MTRLAYCASTFKVFLVAGLLLNQSQLTNAVSLSDFIPEASNLTASCEAVYTAPIPGCAAIDFQSPNTPATCGSSCIEALVKTNFQVYNACSSDPQNNVQLIAAFLSGTGIQALCPNVVVTTLVAGNFVQTTTPSTTSSGKVTATVTADSDGSVIGASTTTTVVSTSSLSGMTMGSQVMVGTSVLVISSSLSGSTSDGIIVDTRTPTVPVSTHHVSSTTSTTTSIASSSSSHVVMTASPSTTNTAPPLNTVTSTSTTTISSTTPTSGTVSSSTSCASAEHGGSPFDYCTTNSAFSTQITDSAGLALIVGVAALLLLI